MNPTLIYIDGSEYELIAARSQDALAVYLDMSIHEGGRRVALFKLRCGASEPEYQMIASASLDALVEMARRRGDLADNVRGALQWQAELQKINPDWGVSPIFHSWFPKNYEHRA
jgi:hypothetical protein